MVHCCEVNFKCLYFRIKSIALEIRMVLHESNEFREHMPHFAPHMIFNPYLLSFGYDPFEAFEIRFSLKSSTWSNAILKNDQSVRFYHPGAYFSQMIASNCVHFDHSRDIKNNSRLMPNLMKKNEIRDPYKYINAISWAALKELKRKYHSASNAIINWKKI